MKSVMLVCLAVACGGSADDVGDAGDGSAADATLDVLSDVTSDVSDTGPIVDTSAPDAPPPPDGGCVTIEGGAPTIIVMRVPSDPPLGVGGPLAVGRYYATTITRFTGDGGASGPDPFFDPLAYTFELDTATSGATRIDSNGTQVTVFTYAVSGTSYDMTTLDCANSTSSYHFDYTSDGSALMLVPKAGKLGMAYVFSKQ